ncbi:OsmC family protein [Zeaxanthinibacter sp. PT1]|uniref:OsmC family protein n=1 Tax=Zeaxanthinibacter TaxID=561554 RepID=UPI00234AFC8C|nr:OsmC family protein [Zeaxanthinibacter sp. PT1]MDC6352226.1 OsmC family protein [Zeaxanthinibacter sp. PT1]
MRHHYNLKIVWTGNTGSGTSTYTGYGRDHTIEAEGKPVLLGSADPAFRGDVTKYNPEELFLASLSACHMLWYLHFCSEAGIKVTEYSDRAEGTLAVDSTGSGRFTGVLLKPLVRVSENNMKEAALDLHQKAHQYCFIANSCNFPVKGQPRILVE